MKCEYHDFTVIQSTKNEHIERCVRCGDYKKYNVVNNQINTSEYLKDHARDFAQPSGKTAELYERFYGRDGETPNKENRK